MALLNQKDSHFAAALVFGDVWPLPQKLLTQYAQSAKTLINVEQNFTGQLARLLREQTGIKMHHSVLKYDGRQLSAREIAESVQKEVAK